MWRKPWQSLKFVTLTPHRKETMSQILLLMYIQYAFGFERQILMMPGYFLVQLYIPGFAVYNNFLRFFLIIIGNKIASDNRINSMTTLPAVCSGTTTVDPVPLATRLKQKNTNSTMAISRGVKFKSVFIILFLKFLQTCCLFSLHCLFWRKQHRRTKTIGMFFSDNIIICFREFIGNQDGYFILVHKFVFSIRRIPKPVPVTLSHSPITS